MKLSQSIDKILAAFGNIRAMERTHIDTHTERLISKIKGEKIAESEFGQLFVDFQDLAGYEFLNAIVLSGTNIKTYKGSSLVFYCDEIKVVLTSDTKEIESDFSNISNRWLTKISFVVTSKDKKMILEKKFDNVSLNFKKKSLYLMNSNNH